MGLSPRYPSRPVRRRHRGLVAMVTALAVVAGPATAFASPGAEETAAPVESSELVQAAPEQAPVAEEAAPVVEEARRRRGGPRRGGAG